MMTSLLEAAIGHAKKHGAKIVEGYPVEPAGRRMSGSEDFTGIVSTFKKVGFVEVLRRSPGRPIMRYLVPNT
jgi:hypothetical protein